MKTTLIVCGLLVCALSASAQTNRGSLPLIMTIKTNYPALSASDQAVIAAEWKNIRAQQAILAECRKELEGMMKQDRINAARRKPPVSNAALEQKITAANSAIGASAQKISDLAKANEFKANATTNATAPFK